MKKIINKPYTINWSIILFSFVLIIPSIYVFQKYFGLWGVLIYILVVFFAVQLIYKYLFTTFSRKFSNKQIFWFTLIGFVILASLFSILYPLANSGLLGKGSDRDEALNIATGELLKGNFPYYLKTYFGNPITPMPGSLILAIPFLLIGNSAYQNFLWLFLFLITMFYFFKDKQSAVFFFIIIFALSPCVIQEFVTGGDLLANSLYVLLSIVWVMRILPDMNIKEWVKILLTVFLGIGFSSRANFLLLLPLIFSGLVFSTGWKAALKYTLIGCLTFLVITLPFYLYDPQNFSPIHTYGKLDQFQGIIPGIGMIAPALTCLLSILLSVFQKNNDEVVLLRNCTIILALPVVIAATLQSIGLNTVNLFFLSYGLPIVFFGTMAFGFWLKKEENIKPNSI